MRAEFENYDGWHNRGYLPHYEAANKYQIITYRLADSLPSSFDIESIKYEDLSPQEKLERRKQIERILDNGYGSCILAQPKAAEIVIQAWKFFDHQRYDLIAYVVMPNHIHLLIKTFHDWQLGELVKSWKRYSTKEIRKLFVADSSFDEVPNSSINILSSNNAFWQREYWDRFIRDERHFHRCIRYIHENPSKAGLCNDPSQWKWSSFNERAKI